MRVGIFSEIYHPIENGVVASIDALCDGLRAAGHDVVVLAPSAGSSLEPSVRIPSLPLPTRTSYRLVIPFMRAEQLSRVKNLSVLHANSPFVTGWMGLRYARRFGIPLVFTYHTQLEEYAHYVPFERGATRRAAAALTRAYANAADAVVVPTAAMERRLRTLGVSTSIAVIPTGIDVARFAAGRVRPDLRARLGLEPGIPLVLYVSRLAREKNVELAFEALGALDGSEPHLILAGDGPERAALGAAARRSGLERRVHFLGHVERAELPDLYASADVFVFPSTTETQGLVLAEAMAAGLPIVAVDSPQTREVLGETGRLVPRSAGAMAAAVGEALRGPKRDQSAAHLAFQRFSLELQTSRVLALYEDLQLRRSA
ncbi:MAG: glycosyltransferase [Candidatus Eremiobacteraeota bacterium]|nr:glycosyltransferase [Candidatus Eremiobacteraeota bacterium]